MLIKDTCPLAAEILDGKHDANLDHVLQAIAARRKSMFRKGARVRLSGTKNPAYEGKEGVILRVNQKTVAVGLGEVVVEGEGTPFAFSTFTGGELNVPPHMLEVV